MNVPMNTHNQLPPHSHDPNPTPPGDDPGFSLRWADQELFLTPEELNEMPFVAVADCYIVSTGHPMSGPFIFYGVPLLALEIDGRPLSRAQGLVRLVVPGETDDALRQVKWVSEIRVV